MKSKKNENEKEPAIQSRGSALGRRDLMKLGAGVVATSLAGPGAVKHAAAAEPAAAGGGNADYDWKKVTSGPGYKNEANRLSGNGPMDNTTRQIVEYVTSFSQANLTDALLPGINTTIIDSLAALITGFESEPGRIGARYGRTIQGDMKSTIFGYGIVTTPEAATLANSMAMRDADWVHSPDLIPGALAIGEALHKSGPEVLTAVVLGLEIASALGKAEATSDAPRDLLIKWDQKYDGVGAALAAGKLLGLNEDRLANALAISLVPQIPLNVSHTGALSHFKSCHCPWHVRAGVSAAIMASHGLTGPAQPFEERGGLFDSVSGPYKELHLPVNPGRLRASEGLEGGGYKRFPTDGNHQAMLEVAIPAIREWTKAEDIASIRIEAPFEHWQENASPPKWDPRNRETADHSYPYVVAYKLIYGDIFLEAFTPKHYIEDVPVRQLMEKITIAGNPDYDFHRSRFIVRKKSGEEFVKDVFAMSPMTHDEVVAKYKRVCDFKGVTPEQRDRIFDAWSNLMKANDIADPIRVLAKYGNPTPL